ncbi:hypothetical protein J2Z43_000125 [Clostridioides mangenotii]|uniref:Uncharacterized protein n=1 Tax=Metaclostridioides mangenotii TaxID=1540 RepID=A0ABS4E719_9FIRM|nr:hypothetical protein [Clostridioides mangenotii]
MVGIIKELDEVISALIKLTLNIGTLLAVLKLVRDSLR